MSEKLSDLTNLPGGSVVAGTLFLVLDPTDTTTAPADASGSNKTLTFADAMALLGSSRQEISVTPDPNPTLDTGGGLITVTVATINGQNAAITSMSANLTGTPNDGDLLTYRIFDDGAGPYTIDWDTLFLPTNISLPVQTGTNQILTVAFQWDGISGRNAYLCQGVTLG